MRIMFDMDGTIADLYAVEDWLARIRANDASPYEVANVMLNMSLFARYLNRVQKAGYQIGIISWTSMCGTPEFNQAIANAKLNWLKQHLPSVSFNLIEIVDYGTPKSNFLETTQDILFDDNEAVRAEWTGKSYTPDQILTVLAELLHAE